MCNPEDSDTRPAVLPIATFKGKPDMVAFLPHVLLPDIDICDLTIPYAHSDESLFPGSLDGYRSIITSLHVTPSSFKRGGGYSVETMLARLGSLPALKSLKVAQLSTNAHDGPAYHFGKILRHFPKLKELSYSISGT